MTPRAKNPLQRLKKRADFQRAAKGQRAHAAALLLQASERAEAEPAGARVGFTTTRKLGGAVVRNRIRRRLRAAVAATQPVEWAPGRDYVVVARIEALRRPFRALVGDIAGALRRLKKARADAVAPPKTL